MTQLGLVIWITGLSGAGKTTLADRLVPKLREQRHPVVHLDGDKVREALGSKIGHTPDERLDNAYRISGLAKLFHDQGLIVVCSTMSLFPEIWEWNRTNIKNYFEVYLKVSTKTLKERDPKGLYRKEADGHEKNVVGIDLPFSEPAEPDLVIDNNRTSYEALSAALDTLMSALNSIPLVTY